MNTDLAVILLREQQFLQILNYGIPDIPVFLCLMKRHKGQKEKQKRILWKKGATEMWLPRIEVGAHRNCELISWQRWISTRIHRCNLA